MKHSIRITIIKFFITVLLITAATVAVISGYLFYKNSFDSIAFSNWLFYAAIAYLAIGIVPMYTVITSSNSVSYTYGEYAVKGKIENQSRVNEAMSKTNHRFSILMAAVSALLFISAFIAERFL